MQRIALILFVPFVASVVGAAETPAFFRQTLKEAERAALDHSPRVKSAMADAESAHARAKSQFSSLWPRISFDASYRHVSEVPVFSPVPGGPAVPFGDHKNYSYGPSLNWLAFNSGGDYNQWKNAEALWRAKQFDLETAERQLLLETRLDYFQVQLGLEQVRELAESLKLAQAQHKDIRLRYRAGSSSRLDALSAHQDVLARKRQMRQAQADLAVALRALFTIIGSTGPVDAAVPIDQSMENTMPPDVDAPTLAVGLDPLPASESALAPAAKRSFDSQHPQLASLSEQVRAGQAAVNAVRSGHYPFLQVYAKTTRDYPNGPVLESINQNTIGAMAGIRLFEFGRIMNDVTAQQNALMSVERRREQTSFDLERDWQKARDQWQGLAAQKPIYNEAIREMETIQKLTYESYQAGQVSFLEVESVNLRVLDSKVDSARNDVQLLIQLAILDSLSKKE